MLPSDKMLEAEVSLRLGFFSIERGYAASDASVAIDGAQVQTKNRVYFPMIDFLTANGWQQTKA
jgi:hypothetical protein